jgi:hypothetical protein
MKKLLAVVMMVAGLIFTGNVSALECLPHQVKTGETATQISQQYADGWVDKLIIRNQPNGRTVWIKPNSQLFPGEMLYIIESKTKSGSNYQKPSSKKPFTGQTVVAQNSQTQPSPKNQKSGLGLKTDLKKGIDNWNGDVGYYQQKDLDAGSKDNKNRGGWGVYAKAHILPWEWKTENRSWKIGPEVRVFKGEADVNADTYSYKGVDVGARAESWKDHKTTGLNAGVGFQETSRDNTSQGQDSTMAYVGASFEDKKRRAEGKKWLPKYYVRGEYRHMIDAETKGGASEYDEGDFNLRGKVGIVDLSSENSSLRVTPTWNAQIGHSQGKESVYLGGGPGFEVGDTKGSDFAEVRFLNPKYYPDNPGASIMETFSISLMPDDIIRAIKADKVKDYQSGKNQNAPLNSEMRSEGH